MSTYKRIDKETILKIKEVRFPLAKKNITYDFDADIGIDSVKTIKNALEAYQKKVMNDTEMSIICEIALKYLDEFKAMDDNKTEAYNKGLEDGRNEVWELASKIQGLDCKIREKIYGIYKMPMIFEKFTPQEALAKLEAYEKEQATFKRGNIVEFVDTDELAIYIGQHADGMHAVVFDECNVPQKVATTEIRKTDKHIDIQGVLRQIGGDVNGNS